MKRPSEVQTKDQVPKRRVDGKGTKQPKFVIKNKITPARLPPKKQLPDTKSVLVDSDSYPGAIKEIIKRSLEESTSVESASEEPPVMAYWTREYKQNKTDKDCNNPWNENHRFPDPRPYKRRKKVLLAAPDYS